MRLIWRQIWKSKLVRLSVLLKLNVTYEVITKTRFKIHNDSTFIGNLLNIKQKFNEIQKIVLIWRRGLSKKILSFSYQHQYYNTNITLEILYITNICIGVSLCWYSKLKLFIGYLWVSVLYNTFLKYKITATFRI